MRGRRLRWLERVREWTVGWGLRVKIPESAVPKDLPMVDEKVTRDGCDCSRVVTGLSVGRKVLVRLGLDTCCAIAECKHLRHSRNLFLHIRKNPLPHMIFLFSGYQIYRHKVLISIIYEKARRRRDVTFLLILMTLLLDKYI